MTNQNHTPAQPGEAAQERNGSEQAEEPRADDPTTTDHAARSVMHPDWHDTDWRYYFGAWGG